MYRRVLAARWTRRPFLPSRTFRRTFLLAGVAIAAASTDPPQPPTLLPTNPVEVRIDDATGIEFPETLRIPSRIPLPTFTLVGLGVRKVSFLRVKVYSVAFYADLSNPSLNIPADASFDDKLEYLIDNTACLIRIVPTRSTSYTHLRDGFVRALQGRLRLARERDTLSTEEEMKLTSPINKVKSMFPNMPLQKHASLDVIIPAPTQSRARTIIFRDIGRVESDWVAKQFVLAYFEGWGISPPMKQSVQAFLANYHKAK